MPLVATRGAASAQGFGEFAQGAAPVYIEDVFSTYLYTGNGSTQTITNGIDLAGKGGLVWGKNRTSAVQHALFDTVRGQSQRLATNLTNAQVTMTPADGVIKSFNSNGFTLDTTAGTVLNDNGQAYASWTFRKAPKFFDVVTWTGSNDVNTNTGKGIIPHNLGSVPGCVIIKNVTQGATNWIVYHRSLSGGFRVLLNTTDAQTNSGSVSYFSKYDNAIGWVQTDPDAQNIYVGYNFQTNGVGDTLVAYVFAHNAGGFGLTGTDNVISCGSFTTDASGNATVNLGYEPQWLLYKNSSSGGDWFISDVMRAMPATTGNTVALSPNNSTGESTPGNYTSVTSTGFVATNFGASRTWIYIAIRRGPMKTPTSGTSVFYPQAVAQTGIPDSTNVPFAPDLVTTFSRNGTDRGSSYDQFNIADRLRGLGVPDNSYSSSKEGRSLVTSSTGSEISANIPNGQSYIQLKADGINITRGGGWGSASYGDWIYYFFRRAPGFFDVVCYTGTGANISGLATNLGVQPELVFLKSRSTTDNWGVGIKVGSSTNYYSTLRLNSTAALGSFVFGFTSTGALAVPSGFSVSGGTYVAYLFATCPGVSKVGSYTGTGTTLQVNCGFTGGARFVLIKRTDSTGDWYVWDSARGIVAGNDPYLLLNSTAAEVTNTDYVDTYSAGFEISSTAPAAINANGGTFIFLAIA